MDTSNFPAMYSVKELTKSTDELAVRTNAHNTSTNTAKAAGDEQRPARK